MRKVSEFLIEHGKPSREVYLDHENSGWVPPEVVNEMLPYFNQKGYGHPSITNRPGWEAYEVLESTLELVGRTLNVSDGELIITHSGTESNNLAIKGAALARTDKERYKIIVSAIEHPSVIFPARTLEEHGFKLVTIPVDNEGFVDPEMLEALIDEKTFMVSIQAVNHEIGTIQNLEELVKIVKERDEKIIFHTDASDAYARIPLDVKKLGIDMMTISSHKIHGPKGVGLLYVDKKIKIKSILDGALSTQRFWPGVENVPALAGFRKAVELAFTDFEKIVERMKVLRDRLIDGIIEKVPDVLLNGPRGEKRAPDNVNVSFLHVEGESITIELSTRGVYVSSGSACTSRVLEPSHVILAIGRRYEEAHGSILFKISRYHTEGDIEYALSQIPPAIQRLRTISPLGREIMEEAVD
ncbi:MAG: cysteine desulfurase [Aigarchaeota archaeon]|nr:cysteine desulfurase [Aigarchaeota archaeon]MCX8192735.1 cysteine desulfurase [Nitrososphaeria archaeon]MDW7985987.1 cysteine desulfurase family protein [Nitrososphaerota archaeon]